MNPPTLANARSLFCRDGRKKALLGGTLLASLLLAPATGLATDGALEVNAIAVSAGGLTPGDAPGFPATLSLPGRYVLTSDLVVPTSADTAVEILADGVTLDLNGFTLSGPALCSGDPVSCSPAGIGVGVESVGSDSVVLDGTVTGMGDAGLRLGPLARVAQVATWLNAGNGIEAGPGSEIRESRAERNGGVGIVAGDGSLVIDNVVRGNLGLGLQLGTDGGYLHNVFSGNAPPAISGGGELGANACPATGPGCTPPQVDCGGFCVDLSSNASHCGACGNTCSSGYVCNSGACTLSCPPGFTDCGGYCADVLSDESNCGGCGIVCSAGFLCSSGSCQLNCGPGLLACSGTCVDPSTDESNCGGCGLVCGTGLVCNAGSCTTP